MHVRRRNASAPSHPPARLVREDLCLRVVRLRGRRAVLSEHAPRDGICACSGARARTDTRTRTHIHVSSLVKPIIPPQHPRPRRPSAGRRHCGKKTASGGGWRSQTLNRLRADDCNSASARRCLALGSPNSLWGRRQPFSADSALEGGGGMGVERGGGYTVRGVRDRVRGAVEQRRRAPQEREHPSPGPVLVLAVPRRWAALYSRRGSVPTNKHTNDIC